MSSKIVLKLRKSTAELGFGTGSIATRLALWCTLLSVSLIVAVSAVLYLSLEDRLREEDDRLIRSMMSEFGDYLKEYSIDDPIFRNELKNEVESFGGMHILIMDLAGNAILESPVDGYGANKRSVFELYDPAHSAIGKDWTSISGEKYRLMQRRLSGPGGDIILVIGINRSVEEAEILETFQQTLIWATICALIVSTLLGWAIARRSTRSLSRLVAVVSEISATNLHRRVRDETWPEELKPLAKEFDELLSRLEASFGRIERFSADIAHELRTPLHILRGEAEMALIKSTTKEEYRACIESAMEEYHRLSRLVESLLFLSRAEQPEAISNRTILDLDQEIQAVSDFYQSMAAENQVSFEVHGEGHVFAESNLLRRAISNIITNALRYTPSGGRVSVEGRELGDHSVEISVTDTGMGISSDQLPHVFERFYRGDKARSRVGTGLGLAIVKSIMKLHGGSVSIRSESNRGTTVTLKFPAQSTAAHSSQDSEQETAHHLRELDQVA